jgi:two-component system OmpR family response regulator
VHIKNIRKKLGAYAQPEWLETVRGLGYKIKM